MNTPKSNGEYKNPVLGTFDDSSLFVLKAFYIGDDKLHRHNDESDVFKKSPVFLIVPSMYQNRFRQYQA
jgi:hypothetical protein